MSNPTIDQFSDDDFESRKLPSGLNVLTILSFIGCGLQLIGAVTGFMGAKKNFDERDKVLEQFRNPDMPKWAKAMIGDPDQFVTLVTKSYENRFPILIVSLLAIGLCIYGLISMRKLKKEGFLFYTIGQVLPMIGSAVFVGTFVFSGMVMLFFTVVAFVFIALYASYRKKMIY